MTPTPPIKVLCFDVFGTVTDWYSSVVREGETLGHRLGIEVPWGEFVLKWRIDGYMKMLGKIASGEMPIMPTADLHRQKLEELLAAYNITGLSEAEIAQFNLAWNRLDVWADVPEGLSQLKENFLIMPFSNGDYRCLLDIAKANKLPWDGIISADFFKKVKPDLILYQDVVDMLQFPAEQVLMVACHAKDLEAAMQSGMKTAYVNRPLEYGPGRTPEAKPVAFDYDVADFIELAQTLTPPPVSQGEILE